MSRYTCHMNTRKYKDILWIIIKSPGPFGQHLQIIHIDAWRIHNQLHATSIKRWRMRWISPPRSVSPHQPPRSKRTTCRPSWWTTWLHSGYRVTDYLVTDLSFHRSRISQNPHDSPGKIYIYRYKTHLTPSLVLQIIYWLHWSKHNFFRDTMYMKWTTCMQFHFELYPPSSFMHINGPLDSINGRYDSQRIPYN